MAWTTTVAKDVWRAALRSRLQPACCPHRPFSTGSPAQEKGWSTQGMKKKTAAHSADAAPAEAAAGGRSVSLNGGTVDKAEVDKFGAIGAVFLNPRCVALRCVELRTDAFSATTAEPCRHCSFEHTDLLLPFL